MNLKEALEFLFKNGYEAETKISRFTKPDIVKAIFDKFNKMPGWKASYISLRRKNDLVVWHEGKKTEVDIFDTTQKVVVHEENVWGTGRIAEIKNTVGKDTLIREVLERIEEFCTRVPPRRRDGKRI